MHNDACRLARLAETWRVARDMGNDEVLVSLLDCAEALGVPKVRTTWNTFTTFSVGNQMWCFRSFCKGKLTSMLITVLFYVCLFHPRSLKLPNVVVCYRAVRLKFHPPVTMPHPSLARRSGIMHSRPGHPLALRVCVAARRAGALVFEKILKYFENASVVTCTDCLTR